MVEGSQPKRISVLPLGGLELDHYTGPTYYSLRRRHIVWKGDYLSANHHISAAWLQDHPQEWVKVK